MIFYDNEEHKKDLLFAIKDVIDNPEINFL